MRQRRERWRRLLERVRDWAADLAGRLGEHGVRVESVILFGSVARGDYTEWSDVDLIIVSRDWERYPPAERLSLLYRLWRGGRDATLIPLTPAELEEGVRRSVVLMDASRYWVRIL